MPPFRRLLPFRSLLRFRSLTVSAATAATITAAVLVTVPGAGDAAAAPCGTQGNGSSLPFFDTGSLGSSGSPGSSGSLGSSGSGSGAAQGPQGPLPHFDNGITRTVAWTTGPRSANRTFTRFGISGTDLGIAWDNGAGQTLLAFGDTFGDCTAPGRQWRHNVLLRTTDDDLTNGLTVPDGVPGDVHSGASVAADAPAFARQMIDAIGWSGVEVTTIPTSAIAIDGKQYLNYMSVRKWGLPGQWDTNFSATAVSSDNGQTWTTPPATIRVNAGVSLPIPEGWPSVHANDSKFQQAAYVKGHGDDDGWVYQFGTPNGRFGGAYLARFRPSDVLDLSRYHYWTGSGWSDSIDDIPGGSAGRVLPAPVTELSVAWSPFLNKYVMLHSPTTGVQMRTADHPEGPWSAPRLLVPGTLGFYAPMMLPQSPALTGTGPDLYFHGSRWDDYNVALVRTRLSR
ncbi:DUF4185 domain-containing protein [Gordonia sp. LUNF6]|uniref:DUF4185 domain-containing protein n=1 Tax=Gordonia sp. LUNF6 TaxID=3388658 RepID=UPI00399C4018